MDLNYPDGPPTKKGWCEVGINRAQKAIVPAGAADLRQRQSTQQQYRPHRSEDSRERPTAILRSQERCEEARSEILRATIAGMEQGRLVGLINRKSAGSTPAPASQFSISNCQLPIANRQSKAGGCSPSHGEVQR